MGARNACPGPCSFAGLFLKQILEMISSFLDAAAGAAAGGVSTQRFEIVAIIGAVLFSDPFGLGFVALIVSTRIVVSAVAAAMEVGITFRVGIGPADVFF